MKRCAHCDAQPVHARGHCRRCISAYVSNPERFERLRKPGFFARIYIACAVTLMFAEELLRDLRKA